MYTGHLHINLSEAKKKVSQIVGRDVEQLSAQGVAQAAVETVAENLVDGVISPLFFAAIGGAPLAAAYKMVNTLDSMVGYKNEKYRQFGKASARIDDIANLSRRAFRFWLLHLHPGSSPAKARLHCVPPWQRAPIIPVQMPDFPRLRLPGR